VSKRVVRRVLSPQERVWAPFTDKGDDLPFSRRWDLRESFFCHGYRALGEHYHKTLEEMEDCPLLRGPDWTPPVRKKAAA
jgi:hypothetical protein